MNIEKKKSAFYESELDISESEISLGFSEPSTTELLL